MLLCDNQDVRIFAVITSFLLFGGRTQGLAHFKKIMPIHRLVSFVNVCSIL